MSEEIKKRPEEATGEPVGQEQLSDNQLDEAAGGTTGAVGGIDIRVKKSPGGSIASPTGSTRPGSV